MKLVKIKVSKNYIWPLRLFFFLVFLYFANYTVDIVMLGKVKYRGSIYSSESVNYYLILIKNLLLSLLNYWFATLGTTTKTSNEEKAS